jgi:thiol-disulfide isomerase/thioredoxin
MRRRHPLLFVVALCAALVLPPAVPHAQAQDAVDPAGGARRTVEEIQADFQKAQAELRDAVGGPEAYFDAAKRAEAGPKVIPVLRRMLGGIDELVRIDPAAKAEADDARLESVMLLTLFGDAAARAELDKLAAAPPPKGTAAQAARVLVKFWQAGKDEAGQVKVIDELRALAKAQPADDAVAVTAIKMTETGPASLAVVERAEGVLLNDLTGELAKRYAPLIQGVRKQRAAVGKPIELTGTTVDGKPFSTKDWKGKVILVDFWATWCAPCVAELPRIKREYIDHHAKGLEVLGVSSDAELERLKAFLEKNPDMAWPQLAAKGLGEDDLHPLAKEWGVARLPAMFLIDRKGVLRSVEGVTEYHELIPKLLAEKAE